MFTDKGCCYQEPIEVDRSVDISSAIPIHEEDASSIVGKLTEGGVEVDTARIPLALMQLADYYMAVKNLYDRPEIKVILLDRMPSIDAPHIIGNAIEFLESNRCILIGIDTRFGKVSNLDLELARMLQPNEFLEIPVARSQLIKYVAINKMIREFDNSNITKISYRDLLQKIGAKEERQDKLISDLTKFNQKYSLYTEYMDNKKPNKHAQDNELVMLKNPNAF